MRPSLALFLVLLLAPFAAPGQAHAQPAQPLDRLLPDIRRANPGQFLDAEPGASDSGSPRYRLKWLTPEGRVIWLDADARTGRVMRRGPDREGVTRREDGPRPEIPRGNFRAPEYGDADPRGRLDNRFGPRPDFNGAEIPPRPFNQDRFNRPSFGDGGYGNRGGFGGRRPGGESAGARGSFGGDGAGRGGFGNRSFGGGRGRGRGE
jgi:hypothetical protein